MSNSYPQSPSLQMDTILNNNQDWLNVQDIVRNAINSLYSLISLQNQTINEIQSSLSLRPTKTELLTHLSTKVETSDFITSINDLKTSLNLHPTFDDVQTLSEDKLTKRELSQILSAKLSIDDAKAILDTKANAIEMNDKLESLQLNIDTIYQDITKQLSTFASVKEVNKLNASLSSKPNINDLTELLSSKPSREEMVNALRTKANKAEVDQTLKNKIDINEINELITILNSKVSHDELDKIYSLLNMKLDKTSISTFNEICNTKLNIKEFESFVQMYTQHKDASDKKIDDIDYDLDNLIDNIKSQFQNVNHVITSLDKNKIGINEYQSLTNEISKRIKSETFDSILNQMKFDINSTVSELKDIINKHTLQWETLLSSRIDIEKNENQKHLELTNKTVYTVNDQIKKIQNEYEAFKKHISDINSKLSFICSEYNAKFNNVYDVLKSKIDFKQFTSHNTKYENSIREFYQELLNNKATFQDIDSLYEKTQNDLKEKTNALYANMQSNLKSLNDKIEFINTNCINGNDFDVLVKKQTESLNALLNTKSSNDDVIQLQNEIKQLKHDLINKTDVNKFDTFTNKVNTFMQDINTNINTKADANEIKSLLDNKVSIKDLNKNINSISTQISCKVGNDDYNKMISNQNIINDMFCNDNAIGKWLWQSGKLKNGYNIPWEYEIINTMTSNYFWDKDKSSLMIANKGLYNITVIIFASQIRDNMLLKGKLIINGTTVCESVVNIYSDVINSSTGCKVGNMYMRKSVKTLERARISVELYGESSTTNNSTEVVNYIGDNMEGVIIIQKI